ncbi:MAG TPA: MATE family efflux transporter [Bryobacteraceae bacterium]|jgi:putative MATE family efflux protein|nr:MATE family efflux transporter [Bryobacteraceae bacterium]
MATTATAPQPQPAGIWHSLLEALRGTEQDFTEGSISRAVLLLATPMVLEMFMESLFAIVDVFWVSRLGANAVATVGLTESMLALVFSVAMGVSLSTTAMVARRTGEKDARGASTAAVQAIALGIVLAVLMGVPSYWFAPQLLGLMGAPAAVIATGHRYTAIVLGGCISVMLLFLNNAIFRGAGDASIAMRVLWFSNLINLALDPVLIFGLGPFPAMGVTGAAVSTLTGRTCGVLYQTWILTRGQSRIRIGRHNLAIVPRVIGSLVRVSSTGVLQWAVANTGFVALVRIIASFGGAALAGYTVGIRIFIFAILPSWGLSGAAATMVGQNLGARKPERAQRAVYTTAVYNMAYMGLVAVVFILAPKALISVFSADPTVVPYGVDCLRILGYGNVVYAFGMVMVQSFNGAGDTVTPTIINLIGYWLCEIPLAYALARRMGMGVRGVFASIPISELFIALMGLAMFLRGSWKRRKI